MKKTQSSVLKPMGPIAIGILALAVNFWGLTPLIARLFSSQTSHVVYLLVRLGVFAGVAAALRLRTDRTVLQIMSLVTLCAFFDQVLFKLGLLWDPARLGGMSSGEIWVSLMMSYLLFLPLVLVLAYLGTEWGGWLSRARSPRR